ncbi:MAG: penicillin acylase family protein, partial [Pseudomonadota bacterium]|nr:penicillin acylase family protein [Pseudomonadota bacterium]
MTLLDCNKLLAIFLLTATVLGVTACSEEPDSKALGAQPEPAALSTSQSESRNEVQLRWTEHGIPHIKANSWEGLGYGFAHAIAANTICVLAREFATVRGEQAKYFGATEANINQDAFHRALLNQDKLDEYLNYGSADSAA